MAFEERWPLVEVGVSETVVIISLKCFILWEPFLNLENGTKDEEFNHPRPLSVRKAGLLIVCDSTNHGTQVFELCRKFVTKFGSKCSERGEFMFPISTANPTDAEGYSDTHNFPVALT